MTSSRAVSAGNTVDVRQMYESFPYPSPTAGGTLIEDVASSLFSLFGNDSLEGKRILDAGCGTGHRLLAVARRYPRAQIVGLDMTSASLEVARRLTRKHGLKNVEFRVGNLLDLQLQESFDVILSVGVIHHLEDPGSGLRSLAKRLRPDGVMAIWLYHSLGEHQRLLDREVLLTLWERSSGFDAGLQMMQQLDLTLEVMRYGSSAAQTRKEVSQLSIDVDAYLHPIVNAYRFEQAAALLRGCENLSWAAINNINLVDVSRLLDLGEVERGDMRHFCQQVDEVLPAPALRERFRQLDTLDKLRVLELRLKPTGFTIVGGADEALPRVTSRVLSQVLALREGSARG